MVAVLLLMFVAVVAMVAEAAVAVAMSSSLTMPTLKLRPTRMMKGSDQPAIFLRAAMRPRSAGIAESPVGQIRAEEVGRAVLGTFRICKGKWRATQVRLQSGEVRGSFPNRKRSAQWQQLNGKE